jgi:exopolysaccharide biosynthesis WecB/TagA/CpsF family protein
MDDTFSKVNILGIAVSNVQHENVLEKIEAFLTDRLKHYTIFTPNTDFLVKVLRDAEFRDALKNADILIPDGMPLVWASYLLRTPLKGKVAGSDLFFNVCHLSAARGYGIFLLGAAEGVAAQAAYQLAKKYTGLKIVGTYSPPFNFENDDDEISKIINMIKAARPDILFVGLGAPKQEKFISRYKKEYKVPLSVAVGASIDFAAGKKKMPPQWVKKIGFAWLWRLCEEPNRLWHRYLIEDMKFFYYVFLQRFGLRDFK